jgi:hypothetical protein
MPARDKLGAPGRHRLQQLEGASDTASAPVSLLLRGREPFSPEQIDQLVRAGARVRTQAGDVLTADVPAHAVDRVLGHDFVMVAEISSPLYQDAGDNLSYDVE